MSKSYWANALARRVSRRRFVYGASALGASAAFIAACGGGDDEGGGATGSTNGNGTNGNGATGGQSSGLLSSQADRSAEAVQGGTLNHTQQNAPSLDAIGSSATLTRFGIQMLYNRLFRVMPGIGQPGTGDLVGDAADSWEYSPDRLTLTVKIRNNLGSDPRPPLNGRNLTAEDVLSSWDRWAATSSLRSDLVNGVNPAAPVQSVSAPDSQTIVFNLAFPSVIVTHYLADGFYFWIMPREANDDGFDPNSAAHGAGPYYLDEFLSGVHYKMSRNPNFYDKPKPYFDKMTWFVIPEAATQIAQFEAKQLDIGAGLTGINSENVVDIKNRHPELLMWKQPIGAIEGTSRFGFAPGDPFHDVRVRHAISMAYDRATLEEYFTNKTKIEVAGLPADTIWESHISAMWQISGNPADPGSFGEGAQYFAYNPEESQKLLLAAGQENLEIEYHMDNFSPANLADAELLAGQLRDGGFTVNQVVEDYVSWFLPTIYRGRGNWNGMAHGAVGGKFTPETHVFSYFHPAAGTCHFQEGMFPQLVDRANQITSEFDDERREQLIKDFEQAAAAEMPCLPLGSAGTGYGLAWPWVANSDVLRAWNGDQVANRTTTYTSYWFDADLARQHGRT